MASREIPQHTGLQREASGTRTLIWQAERFLSTLASNVRRAGPEPKYGCGICCTPHSQVSRAGPEPTHPKPHEHGPHPLGCCSGCADPGSNPTRYRVWPSSTPQRVHQVWEVYQVSTASMGPYFAHPSSADPAAVDLLHLLYQLCSQFSLCVLLYLLYLLVSTVLISAIRTLLATPYHTCSPRSLYFLRIGRSGGASRERARRRRVWRRSSRWRGWRGWRGGRH